jgi:hypothetical protein
VRPTIYTIRVEQYFIFLATLIMETLMIAAIAGLASCLLMGTGLAVWCYSALFGGVVSLFFSVIAIYNPNLLCGPGEEISYKSHWKGVATMWGVLLLFAVLSYWFIANL